MSSPAAVPIGAAGARNLRRSRRSEHPPGTSGSPRAFAGTLDPASRGYYLSTVINDAAMTDQDRALKLWVVLARAFRSIQAHAVTDQDRHELSEGEFAVLEALYHKGPMLLNEVQKKVLVSSGGITYLIDRLAKKGLVERRPCASDRRAIYAALTGEGERLIGRIFPAHAEAIEHAMAGLSSGEKDQAIELLRRLGRAAEEASFLSDLEAATADSPAAG